MSIRVEWIDQPERWEEFRDVWDETGRPQCAPVHRHDVGLSAGEPSTMDGFEVLVADSIPPISTGSNPWSSIAHGAHQASYQIRKRIVASARGHLGRTARTGYPR